MTKEEVLRELDALVHSDRNMPENFNEQRSFSKWDKAELSRIAKIAEGIDKDHVLSRELWETQKPAAQLLSFLAEQPEKVTERQLDSQIQEISSPELVDVYCKSVVFESPYVNAKVEEWSHSGIELVKRAAYMLVWLKAKKGEDFTDGDFLVFLDRIRNEMGTQKDVVKEAMCNALIAIGRRNRFLNKQALEVAHAIGEVHLTNPPHQKMPDARVVLQRDNTFTAIN